MLAVTLWVNDIARLRVSEVSKRFLVSLDLITLEVINNISREESPKRLVTNLWDPSAPEIRSSPDAIHWTTDITIRAVGALDFGFHSVIYALVTLGGVACAAVEVRTRSIENVG
jgi:hypothetical protein